jgi:peptidoglycan/LPS O-acetylase OafA/YrhL
LLDLEIYRRPAPNLSNKIYILDVLRVAAIAFVFATHYFYHLLPGGSVGVSIFFALSGFLVTKILLSPQTRISAFLVRRIFRIYPAYVAVILLQIGLMWFTGDRRFDALLHACLGLLFFIKMPDWIGMGIGVFWTLQVEILFYFALAGIFWLTRSNRQMLPMIFGTFCVISLACKASIIFGANFPRGSIFSFLVWSDGLFYGALAAYFTNERGGKFGLQEISRIAPKALFLVSMALILIIALLIPSKGNVWLVESSVVSFLSALSILLYRRSNTIGIWHIPGVSYVAAISYSLYLCHAIPLDYGLFKTLKIKLTIVLIFGSPAIFMDQAWKTGWSSRPPRWKRMSCLKAS